MLEPKLVDALVAARRQRATSVLDRLIERALEVLEPVARGDSNRAIADAVVEVAEAPAAGDTGRLETIALILDAEPQLLT